jgi:hypothetical protein
MKSGPVEKPGRYGEGRVTKVGAASFPVSHLRR